MDNGQDEKTWYKSLYKLVRPYQFNWIGRTREGVSRWIGAPMGPSERVCKNLTRYGFAMGLIGLLATAAIMMHVEGNAPLGLLALIGAIHGVVFSVIGLWLQKVRRGLAQLKTVEELAAEYGATPDTVQRLADTRGIRARININGDNLYDPEEFVASRSLLRAAFAPSTGETLLRPVEPGAQPGTELLLQPTEPAAGLTPIQQLFYAPDDEIDDTEEQTQYLRR